MNWDEDKYDEFVAELEGKYPAMFENPYGGVCVGPGWWEIIRVICRQIDSYTKWRNNTREALLKANPYNHEIPNEVKQVVVLQIKEKFGGLRFYYEGGDDYIRGLIDMAESWAAHSCEECGKPGESRSGGWIKVLCDEHEAERQERLKKEI